MFSILIEKQEPHEVKRDNKKQKEKQENSPENTSEAQHTQNQEDIRGAPEDAAKIKNENKTKIVLRIQN